MSEDKSKKSIKPVSSVHRSAPAQTAPKAQQAQKDPATQKTGATSQASKSEPSKSAKESTEPASPKSPVAHEAHQAARPGLHLDPDRFQKSVDLEEEETRSQTDSSTGSKKEEGLAVSLLRGLFGLEDKEPVQKETAASEKAADPRAAERTAPPDNAGEAVQTKADPADARRGVESARIAADPGREAPALTDENAAPAKAAREGTPTPRPESKLPDAAADDQGSVLPSAQVGSASTQQLLNAVEEGPDSASKPSAGAPGSPTRTEDPKAPEQKPEGLLGTLGQALGLKPQEPDKTADKTAPEQKPEGLLGVLGTLGQNLGRAVQDVSSPAKPAGDAGAAGPLSSLLGRMLGTETKADATSGPSAAADPKAGNPLLKSVLGGALGALSPLAGAATALAGGAPSSLNGAATGQAPKDASATGPAVPNPPIGKLQGVSELSTAEHQKVVNWYNQLSPEDRNWYENWVGSQPPEKQGEALAYARRVQDQYISDPQARVQMRQSVLDEYLSQGVKQENRASMGAIVLTDENPANKRRALEDNGFTKPPADGTQAPSVGDLMAAPGAYDTRTNNVMFSTALLRQDRGTNYVTDVVGHELAHQTADSTQTGKLLVGKDNQLFFALEKERAFEARTGTPEARARSQQELADLYRDSNPGTSKRDARAWAENALSSSEEYYASVTALHRLTEKDPRMAQRVEGFDRDTHTLIHHAEAGTLPTDEQFLKSMSSKDLATRYKLDPTRLDPFEGYQEDTGRRIGLEKYLLEQVGLHLVGANPAGAQTYGSNPEEVPTGQSSGSDPEGPSPVKPLSSTSPTRPTSSAGPLSSPQTTPTSTQTAPTSAQTQTTPTSTQTAPASAQTQTTPTSSNSSGSRVSSDSLSLSGLWNDLTSSNFSSLGNRGLSLSEIQQMLPEGLDLTGLDIKTLDLDQDGHVTKADLSRLAQMAKAGNVARPGEDWTPLSRLLVQLGGQGVSSSSLASVFSGSAVRRLVQGAGTPAAPGSGGPQAEAGQPQPAATPTASAPASAATVAPVAGAPGASQAATRDPGMTALRVGIFREASTSLEAVAAGTPQNQGLWALDSLGLEADGRLGVTDAFETLVTGPKGAEKMIGVFDHAASSPDQALAMSSVLKDMAQAAPDRAMGILLLTMDAPGGTESVSRMFSAMSQEPGGAVNLARFLQISATDKASARGLWEMMDTLTTPTLENTNGGKRLAGALGRSSDWVQGSQALTRTFSSLLDTEGGGTRFANLIHRMSDSRQGAADTARMLQNMASDREDSREVGKLLAQGTRSRSGARAVVEGFNQMAATKEGGVSVSRLFLGISGGRDGARVLANLARDSSSAAPLLSLLNRLEANPPAAARFSKALDRMDADPKLRTEMAIFRGRAAATPELEAALQRVWTPRQAGVAREAAPMPLTWGGALAMDQAGLGSRQTALPMSGPSASAAGPQVTGPGAPVSASAHGAGTGQRDGQGSAGQEGRRPASALQAAPPELVTAPGVAAGRVPDLPARIAWPALGEAGLPPAPQDAIGPASGRGVGAEGPAVQASLLPPAAEARPTAPTGFSAAPSAPQPAAEARPTATTGSPAAPSAPQLAAEARPTATTGFSVAPGVFASDWQGVARPASDAHLGVDLVREAARTTGVRPATAASDGAMAGQGARASGEAVESQKPAATPFRPGDYYSEDTLRSLRLCPECGFRTSSAGVCARCVASAFREGRILRAVVGIQA